MSALPTSLRPVLAAVLFGIASAPLLLSLVENGNGQDGAQREAHVELQAFQLKRVQAAMAVTEGANAPQLAPSAIHTAAPSAPGYRWLLSADVPSAPGMPTSFEPDPVQIAFMEPVAPMGTIALTE